MPVPDRERLAFEALRDEPSQLQRSLVTAAILTRALAGSGLEPVVVGGTAVSFYTGGTYESLDLDVVMPGLEPAAAVLAALGFRRNGAVFAHPRVPVVVDFPPEPLEGERRLVRTVVVDGTGVRVIGVEDVLLERIYLSAHDADERARDAAVAMAAAHWEEIDWPYVRERAASASWNVVPALDQVLQDADRLRRTEPE